MEDESYDICINANWGNVTFTYVFGSLILGKKNTIHQVTTMLATSKNVPFPGYNHLLTTSADDPITLIITLIGTLVIILEVLGHQHQWLAGGYDLEIGTF